MSGTDTGGDQINVGNITGAQGTAIGRNAHAEVLTRANISGDARIDSAQLRSALEELYGALAEVDLVSGQNIGGPDGYRQGARSCAGPRSERRHDRVKPPAGGRDSQSGERGSGEGHIALEEHCQACPPAWPTLRRSAQSVAGRFGVPLRRQCLSRPLRLRSTSNLPLMVGPGWFGSLDLRWHWPYEATATRRRTGRIAVARP